MNGNVLDLEDWRKQLQVQGHDIVVPGFAVHTTELIAMLLNPDDCPTIPRRFACAPEAKRVFQVVNCPEPHRGRWLEIVKQVDAEVKYYLAGPGSWTLARLARFREILFWSNEGVGPHGIDPPDRNWSIDIPREAVPFFPAEHGPATRPRRVTVDQKRFADLIAACFIFAFDWSRSCFIADAAGTEVYWVGNDWDVFVSIPDADRRRKLLRELEVAPFPFANVSGRSGKGAFFIFGAGSDRFGPGDYIVHVPASLTSHAVLLQALSRQLQLPANFGQGCDNLWDSLYDYLFRIEKRVVIVHADLPSLDKAEITAYLDVLHYVSDSKPDDDEQLLVIFPAEVREQVRGLLD